jgi:Domain of unknown function (DUF222)
MKSSSVKERPPQSVAPDPLLVLDGLVSTLVSVESAIAALQGVREYTLALASKVGEAMASDGGAAPAGFDGPAWEARAVELAQRSVAAEVATATRLSDRTVQRQMSQATELLDRFPATFAALAQGRISLAHVRIIQDAGAVLDDPDARARYEDAVVSCALVQAPGRVRHAAAREAEKASTQPLVDRHQRAVQDRRVWVNPLPDGMAELGAILPAAVAHGIHDRLTQMAHTYTDTAHNAGNHQPVGNSGPDTSGVTAQTGAFSAAGHAGASAGDPARERLGDGIGDRRDSRSVDQLRADLLSDLLLRGAPTGHDTPDGILAAITARVDITIPAPQLLPPNPTTDHPDNHPNSAGTMPDTSAVAAELDGRHPIDPDTARLLAGAAPAWNRVFTHPAHGTVLTVDRYRPTEDLRRLLSARDSRCRFPGCGIAARHLDLDHTQDAATGGPTTLENLAGLCRRHHMLKHHTGWTLKQLGNGILEWTSPTGRKHTDQPPTPATNPPGSPDPPF